MGIIEIWFGGLAAFVVVRLIATRNRTPDWTEYDQ